MPCTCYVRSQETLTAKARLFERARRCHGTEPDGMTEKERIRLRAVAAIGEHLGDELEQLAAAVGDLKGSSSALKALLQSAWSPCSLNALE